MGQNPYAGRESLTGNRRRTRKFVDMEEAYRMLDGGMNVKDVCAHFGVSPRTLYKKHRQFQEMLKLTEEDDDPFINVR